MVIVVATSEGGPTWGTYLTLLLPPETTPLLLDHEESHPRPPNPARTSFSWVGT